MLSPAPDGASCDGSPAARYEPSRHWMRVQARGALSDPGPGSESGINGARGSAGALPPAWPVVGRGRARSVSRQVVEQPATLAEHGGDEVQLQLVQLAGVQQRVLASASAGEDRSGCQRLAVDLAARAGVVASFQPVEHAEPPIPIGSATLSFGPAT